MTINIQDIPDNALLYKFKKYKLGFELINDNVPLNIVRRRLLNKHIIQMSEEVRKKEKQQINRKCAIINGELRERAFKVIIIDPKSDKICLKCEFNSNYHPKESFLA
jgi:hypothetical protein